MKIGMIGAFVRNYPFATELAFKKGLESIDCDVHTFDPTRPNDETNNWNAEVDAVITFKNALGYESIIEDAKKNGAISVVYQPDDIRAPGITDMLIETQKYCDFALTFDSRGAEWCIENGYENASELLVCADGDVYYPIPNMKKEIDILFVGSYSNPVMHKSRQHMTKVLHNAGFKVTIVSDIWDPCEINRLYNRAKIVLNHATDVGQKFGTGYGYQCRHFEAGMAGACLLSNAVNEHIIRNLCTFDSEESLIETTELLLDLNYGDIPLYEKCASMYHEEITSTHNPTSRALQLYNILENWIENGTQT